MKNASQISKILSLDENIAYLEQKNTDLRQEAQAYHKKYIDLSKSQSSQLSNNIGSTVKSLETQNELLSLKTQNQSAEPET